MKNKTLLIAALIIAVLFVATTARAQAVVEPEIGSIDTIKNLHKVYVICEDGDVRETIIKMLSGYSGVEVVDSPKQAEFYLEMKTLTRDTAATFSGGAILLKSQMRAFIVKPEDETRVIAWTETETYERHTTISFTLPNELNLTHHFVNLLQVARSEKKSSIRQLFKGAKKKPKKD
jgi:hypothetical protein